MSLLIAHQSMYGTTSLDQFLLFKQDTLLSKIPYWVLRPSFYRIHGLAVLPNARGLQRLFFPTNS